MFAKNIITNKKHIMADSSEIIIQTNHLDFGFSKQNLTLKDLNLKVKRGAIYGFLGQNGAGKTTTIKLLTGLLSSPENSVQLFGSSLSKSRIEIFKRMGTFIEVPSLYEHLTGNDNLEITRRLRDIPKKRIAEVLSIVQLSRASGTKVKKYSLGMKQRLAIALALLSEPELLILDEPTNGLDPNGINEIRELLLQLNRTLGTTILISSHLLSEIEKMATHLGIIHKGSLIFQGTMEQLLLIHQTKSCLLIQTNDNIKAREILQQNYQVDLNTKGVLELILESTKDTDIIANVLISNKLNVSQLQILNPDLEEIYLELTKN